MLTVSTIAVAVCAMLVGIGMPVINFRLDSLNGPPARPIPAAYFTYCVLTRRQGWIQLDAPPVALIPLLGHAPSRPSQPA